MTKIHLNVMNLKEGYAMFEKAINMFNEVKDLDYYEFNFEQWKIIIGLDGKQNQVVSTKKGVYFQLMTFYFYNNYHPML